MTQQQMNERRKALEAKKAVWVEQLKKIQDRIRQVNRQIEELEEAEALAVAKELLKSGKLEEARKLIASKNSSNLKNSAASSRDEIANE